MGCVLLFSFMSFVSFSSLFVIYRGISHSAISDMQTIQQDAPEKQSSKFDRYESRSSRSRNFYDDDFEPEGFSSKSAK